MSPGHDGDHTEPTPDRVSEPGGVPEPAPLAATPRPRGTLPPGGSIAMVAVGGAAGALGRTAQSVAFPVEAGAFPWSTLAENLAGAFLLGALLTVLTERMAARWWVRPLLGTGVLGAYTTYATVGLELHELVAGGSAALATAYLSATAVVGLLAGGAGMAAARLGFRGTR